ncbi:oligomeric, coiled-coil, peripheral membrane protein [Tulasnella sp. 419]|nr:oligomeric, coiled-coil, peripheral membrane protein [Tulasnella sp. 419]
MLVTRAEDGESFNGNPTSRDIDQLLNLKAFLNRLTGVPEDAIISFTEDGVQLRNDNVRELLGGVEDVSVFVYNRNYLDDPIEQVVNELSVEPQLQPPVEGKHNELI